MTHLLNVETSRNGSVIHFFVFFQDCQEEGFITEVVILRILGHKFTGGKKDISLSFKIIETQLIWCLQVHLLSWSH